MNEERKQDFPISCVLCKQYFGIWLVINKSGMTVVYSTPCNVHYTQLLFAIIKEFLRAHIVALFLVIFHFAKNIQHNTRGFVLSVCYFVLLTYNMPRCCFDGSNITLEKGTKVSVEVFLSCSYTKHSPL